MTAKSPASMVAHQERGCKPSNNTVFITTENFAYNESVARRKKTGRSSSRVVVIDDDPDSRLQLKGVLQSADDFGLAGEFSNCAEALSAIPCLQPDLVVMAFRQPGTNGIACLKRLRSTLTCVRVILTTLLWNGDSIEWFLREGADGCLVKPITAEQCLPAFRSVMNRPSSIKGVFTLAISHRTPVTASLSQRERQVMEGLATGLLYKEIADRLGISYDMVHKYQHKLFQKLHVSNRSEAIRVWLNCDRSIRSLNIQVA